MGLESDQNKILFEIYKLLTPENEMPLVFKKQDIYNFVNYVPRMNRYSKIAIFYPKLKQLINLLHVDTMRGLLD